MAKQVLEARVRQKTDTLANWEDNELILLGGEQAFILNEDGTPVNFRIGDGTKTFAQLPNWIAYDQAAYSKVTGTVMPASDGQIHYTILGAGTYTQTGGANVVIPVGSLGIVSDNGTTWSVDSTVTLPTADVSNKLDTGGYEGTGQDLDDKINLVESELYVEGEETTAGVQNPANGLANVSSQTCIHGVPVSESGEVKELQVYCTAAGQIKLKVHKRISSSSPWIFDYESESILVSAVTGLNTFTQSQLGIVNVESGDYLGIYTDATAKVAYIAVTSPAFPYQYRATGDVITDGVTFTAVSTAQMQIKATIVSRVKISDKIAEIEQEILNLKESEEIDREALEALETKLNNFINAVYGLDNGTTYAPIQPLSAMTASGGGNNQGNFNRYALDVSKTYISCQIRSVGNQTVTILKLAADGLTITETESFPVTAGVVSHDFATPITIQAGERIGFKGSGGVSFFYSSTADVGSRNKNQAGAFADSSSITWAFSLTAEGVMPEYDDFGIVTNKLKTVEANVKANRPSSGIEKFNVQVNVSTPNYANTSVAVSDSVNNMNDMSAIWIPTTYTPAGIPTRLIVYCHGAGSAVNSARTNIEQHPLLQYLRQKGYAILDTNAYPADYWETGEQEAKCASMGGLIAIQATQKAYKYVLDKYNIADDGVILIGTSMGGLTSTNVMNNCNIPVLTHVLEAPITDMYNQPWIKPWFGGAKGTRFQLAKFYNFTDYQNFDFAGATNAQRETYWQENKSKVVGFDPVNWQAQVIGGVKQKLHKSPLLIFHSLFDTTSEIQWSINMVNAIKQAGGKSELRTIDDGNVYSNQHARSSIF